MFQTKIVSQTCPTWYRASCHEAAGDTQEGYFLPGLKLAGSLHSALCKDFEDDEIEIKLEELAALIATDDDERVLAWFDRELPRCMELVPRRRRAQFLKGVRHYVIEQGDDITQF